MTDHRVPCPHAGSPMSWANIIAGPAVLTGWGTGPLATAGSALTGGEVARMTVIAPQDGQGLDSRLDGEPGS
jgi:hypothetical protein